MNIGTIMHISPLLNTKAVANGLVGQVLARPLFLIALSH